MDPVLLQTDAERFQVLLGDGWVVTASLVAATRRAIAPGRPALQVATEIVRLALETGTFPRDATTVDLARLAGSTPTGIEELRHRLA